MEDGLKFLPELVPPGQEPTLENLKSIVIEHGCGLRPGRKGGIRLETSYTEGRDGEKVPLVFNYGYAHKLPSLSTILTPTLRHAGYGYESSWGSASWVLEELNKVFVAWREA